MGFPEETRSEIHQTIRFARQLKDLDYAFFSFATPYPGTELARVIESRGQKLNLTMNSLDFFEPHIETKEFGTTELHWLRLMAAIAFYSTPRRFMKIFRQLLNRQFWSLYVDPALRLLHSAMRN
jgi:radical SAM superfamily enzyme YgiQ (UPF0313 family)